MQAASTLSPEPMQVRLDSVSVWVCVGVWVWVCEACTALHSLRAEQGKKKSKPQAKAQTKPKPTKPISADNADADDCNASPLSAQVRCSIPQESEDEESEDEHAAEVSEQWVVRPAGLSLQCGPRPCAG